MSTSDIYQQRFILLMTSKGGHFNSTLQKGRYDVNEIVVVYIVCIVLLRGVIWVSRLDEIVHKLTEFWFFAS